jgi:hypothetical protein
MPIYDRNNRLVVLRSVQRSRRRQRGLVIALILVAGAWLLAGKIKENLYDESWKIYGWDTAAASSGPLPVHKPVVQPSAGQSVAALAASIYQLESSGGLHDPCVASKKGYNGYGYAPGTCYKTHAEVEALVIAWLTLRADWPLPELLCYYNLGVRVSTCEYYQDKYLKL